MHPSSPCFSHSNHRIIMWNKQVSESRIYYLPVPISMHKRCSVSYTCSYVYHLSHRVFESRFIGLNRPKKNLICISRASLKSSNENTLSPYSLQVTIWLFTIHLSSCRSSILLLQVLRFITAIKDFIVFVHRIRYQSVYRI